MPRRIEETREPVPRDEMQLAHLVLWAFVLDHAGHPDLTQLRRVLSLDVLSQLLRHLLGQFLNLIEVIRKPIRLGVQVEEHTWRSITEPIAILRGACRGPVLNVVHTELARRRRVVEVALDAVAQRVIGEEL